MHRTCVADLEAAWQERTLTLRPFGAVRFGQKAEEYELADAHLLEAQLEADQLTLQGMLLQRHVGGVRGDIVACEARLRLVAEVLEQWQGLGLGLGLGPHPTRSPAPTPTPDPIPNQVLEQWQGCQQLWRSLTTLLRQPADCSLARQLPVEMARFRTADLFMRQLMSTAALSPRVLKQARLRPYDLPPSC